MALLSFLAKKPLLQEAATALIVDAIRASEKKTSGEIRVYVESHCKFVDSLDRAAQIFYSLKMNETANSNAVLVYVAVKDHQLAVFADEGIYKKAGAAFWNTAVKEMLQHFNMNDYGSGVASVVTAIGNTLQTHFPYDSSTDKNELPDDIVFGK
ncbi:MAG: TPM domain-containing protein [Chitinophagaceae bacterium]